MAEKFSWDQANRWQKRSFSSLFYDKTLYLLCLGWS
jgi:hypothetical protein